MGESGSNGTVLVGELPQILPCATESISYASGIISNHCLDSRLVVCQNHCFHSALRDDIFHLPNEIIHLPYIYIIYIPVVPHKAVAEVSKIGNL